MSTRRKHPDPMPVKVATPSKRKRDTDSESEESSNSDSELSDLEEELELVEPRCFRPPMKQDGDEDEDDEAEEEEEDFDESSEDDDTPEEAEDSYVFEEEKDISEEEPRRKSTSKPLPKEPISRSSARRRSGPAQPSPRRRPNTSHPSSTVTRRSNQKATPQQQQQTRTRATGVKPAQADEKPFKLTLKVGKDKLREATSNWTPPPAAADSGPGTTAAATPESSSSATSEGVAVALAARGPTITLPARAGRGRKIIEEDTSSSSSSSEEDEDAEGEEDVEGEEVEGGEEPEGDVDDDGLNDEDAEGETDDEELADSDGNANGNTGVNTPDFRSRTGTPDMSKLTRRQRGRYDDFYTAPLLELPTGIERPGAAKIVPLTADEAALKRAEMARRRKNLTDQRLEEEKMDTINKLLKKQTPKMRKGRGTGDATPAGGPDADSTMGGMPELLARPPTMVRWVSSRSGTQLGVPESWLAGPAGAVFERQTAPRGFRGMVEVIDDQMEIDSRA